MASNVSRFKEDLDRLLKTGSTLDFSMLMDVMGEKEFKKQIFDKNGGTNNKWENFKTSLPNFKSEYDSWYSESIAVIRQLLPDRLADFRALYEKPKGRKSIQYGNYVIQDFLQNLAVTFAGDVTVGRSAAVPQFRQQYAILKAAEKRFESSLFEMRQLVQADFFDSEIDAARELLKNKFFRAAGAMAGVVLEKHLKQVCADHGVKVSKGHPAISDLNQALRDANVIDVPQWRFNQHLADLRNLCDHGKASDPTKEQVQALIDGASKVLKSIA